MVARKAHKIRKSRTGRSMREGQVGAVSRGNGEVGKRTEKRRFLRTVAAREGRGPYGSGAWGALDGREQVVPWRSERLTTRWSWALRGGQGAPRAAPDE